MVALSSVKGNSKVNFSAAGFGYKYKSFDNAFVSSPSRKAGVVKLMAVI